MKWLFPFHPGRREGQNYTSQRSQIHTNDEEIPPQRHEIIPEGNTRWETPQDACALYLQVSQSNLLSVLNTDPEPLNPSLGAPIHRGKGQGHREVTIKKMLRLCSLLFAFCCFPVEKGTDANSSKPVLTDLRPSTLQARSNEKEQTAPTWPRFQARLGTC